MEIADQIENDHQNITGNSTNAIIKEKVVKPKNFKEMKKYLNDSLVDLETDLRQKISNNSQKLFNI